MSARKTESKSTKMYRHEPIESSDGNPSFNIFKDDFLIAEVRGTDPANQTVIPMRELDDYDEDKLQEYLKNLKEES